MKISKLNIIIIALILVLLVACSTEATTTDNQSVPEELIPVSIQLAWIHEYSVSPFHDAIESGEFANNGLDATLYEGGFNENGAIDVIETVLSGEREFGLNNASTLIQARSEGKPVVAVMTVFQRSPFALLSLESEGVQRPQDLVGKTVSISDGARLMYDSLLQTLDINPDEVDTQQRTEFGVAPLLNGDVDVLGAWVINEGVAIEEAGENYNAILMSDYAVDTYQSVLFTTEEYLENNPETVQAVVNALTSGMQHVVDDPEQAIEYTLLYNEELDREAQLRRLNATIPLMNVPDIPLGFMAPDVWAFTHQILLDNNVITGAIDLENLFTNDFISNTE